MRTIKNHLTRILFAGVALLASLVAPSVRADYASTVSGLSPLGYWRLNETAASPALNAVTNASTYGSVMNGAVVLDATPGQAGVVGNSVRFINTGVAAGNAGSKIDVPFNYALNKSGAFSVECWVKPAALGADGTGMAVFSSMMNDFAAASRTGYLLYMNNAGRFEFRLGNAGGYVGTVNNTANPPHAGAPGYPAVVGNWSHVVCVFDGARTIIYVNGTNVATRALTGLEIAALRQNTQMPFRMSGTPFNGTLSDSPWISAGGVSGNRGIDAWLDEVAYYPYALTTNICAAHYQAATTNIAGYSAQILADGPAGYWPLNEAAVVVPSTNSYVTVTNIGSVGVAANGKVVWGGLTDQSGSGYGGFGGGNRSVLLDGANGHIKLPMAAGLDVTNNITMMAWVKPSVKNFHRDIIARGWDEGYAETFLRITRGTTLSGTGFGTTNHYEVGVCPNQDEYDSVQVRMPEGDLNNWVFLAGTYDSGTWTLYRNGQPIGTKASAFGAFVNTNAWTIGAQSLADTGGPFGVPGGISSFFGGMIDEPAIFGSALSAANILAIYNAAEVAPVITRSVATPNGFANATWPQLFQGRSTTLSVWAEGSPTLGYQWYSNGIPLGVTTSNLNLVGMVVATPTYSVIVTNAYGSATSSVTLSIINSAPSVTLQPVPLARFVGSPFSFSAAAGGSTPMSFLWKTNGTDAGAVTTGVDVGNETTASYAGTAALNNAFGYSASFGNVIATNSTTTAALQVFPTPFGFSAAAMGSSPIAYWRLGETSGSIAYDYIGANNGTYFTATLGEDGYSVTDTNKAAGFGGNNSYVGQISGLPGTGINFEGTNASFTIELWANGAEGQTDESSLVAKGTGSDGTTASEQFAIDVAFGNYRFMTRGNNNVIYSADGDAGPNDTWQHVVAVYDQSNPASPQMRLYVNGVLSGSGTGRPPGNGGLRASTALVSIGSKRLGNAPDYNGTFSGSLDEVVIYNTAMSLSTVEAHYAAAYGTNLAPQIVVQPKSVTNYAGLNATFKISAIGTLPLTYQWMKGGVDIGGANGSTYTINGLIGGDAGNYTCGVSNSVAPYYSNSAIAVLTVLPAPTSSPAIPGLVMLHQFESDLIDDTGRGNNGTAISKTHNSTNNAATATYNAGKVGAGAYHYQSDFGPAGAAEATTMTNTAYVSLGVRPDLQFSSNVNFSVAFWIKLLVNDIGGDLPFFTATLGSLGNQGYVFSPAYGYGNGSGATPATDPLNYGGWGVSLYNAGGLGSRIYGALGGINDGEWHHMVYVFNRSSQVTIYQNGTNSKSFKIAGTTTAAADTIDTGLPAILGQDPTGIYAETGQGDLDDLAVWTRALTPLEAANVYVASLGGFSPAYVPPPVIGTHPSNITAPVGTATNLSVVVTSTSTGVTNYQWQRNANNIPGATNATLNIASMAFTNYGDYRCKVDDGGLIVYSTTALVRPPAPSVLSSPTSKIVPGGLNTSFSGSGSTLSGSTNYQWMRGSPLTNVSGGNYSGITTPTLTVTAVQSINVNQYALRIGDGYNFVTSSVATLTIANQPIITNTLSGTTLNLTFASQVGPSYVTEWKGALTNGAWNRFVTNSGTGSPISVPTSTTPDTQRFYRIRMQ